MNLKDKLDALKKQAEEIMPKVADGDKVAMAKAAKLADEIEKVSAELKAAEDFEAKVKGIGVIGAKNEKTSDQPRTLGDFVAAGVKSKGIPQKSTVNYGTFTNYKTAGDPMAKPADVDAALADVQERLYEGYRRRLVVADLFGQETTTRGAVTYFVEAPDTDTEGKPAFTAEGAKKPGVTFGDPEPVTESVRKLASWYKETDEMLDDLPWLATSINNRGIYLHQVTKEDALLNGDGSGNNIRGVLNRTGILTEQTAAGEANVADALFRGMTKVETTSGFDADAIVINPTDYQNLRLAKDSDNQYYGGGFFAGPYGNGQILAKPPIWGLTTVVTPAIAAGTALVGAFKLGGAVISRKGLTVEMANTNEDDFLSNRIVIRIEERLALAIRYPSAFCKVTVAPAA